MSIDLIKNTIETPTTACGSFYDAVSQNYDKQYIICHNFESYIFISCKAYYKVRKWSSLDVCCCYFIKAGTYKQFKVYVDISQEHTTSQYDIDFLGEEEFIKKYFCELLRF